MIRGPLLRRLAQRFAEISTRLRLLRGPAAGRGQLQGGEHDLLQRLRLLAHQIGLQRKTALAVQIEAVAVAQLVPGDDTHHLRGSPGYPELPQRLQQIVAFEAFQVRVELWPQARSRGPLVDGDRPRLRHDAGDGALVAQHLPGTAVEGDQPLQLLAVAQGTGDLQALQLIAVQVDESPGVTQGAHGVEHALQQTDRLPLPLPLRLPVHRRSTGQRQQQTAGRQVDTHRHG